MRPWGVNSTRTPRRQASRVEAQPRQHRLAHPGVRHPGGIRSYGGYPDIDALYKEQAVQMDVKKREAILFKIQQLMHEKVMFAPIVEPVLLDGYGAKVADPALGLIVGHLYSAPYEDLA
jgi:ABC-type transport system substrate-binding protein